MRRTLAWLFAIVGTSGSAVACCAIWVLISYYAAGLAWYGTIALFGSGPVAAAGAMLAFRRPRSSGALVLGIIGFLVWALLLVTMFAVLGFRVHRR